MPTYEVSVTHTTVHRFNVKADSEEHAKVRAIEVIKEHELSDDVTIPEEVLNTYDASTDPEAIRRALSRRATRGNGAGEAGRANR
jgi:hypothetical protein